MRPHNWHPWAAAPGSQNNAPHRRNTLKTDANTCPTTIYARILVGLFLFSCSSNVI